MSVCVLGVGWSVRALVEGGPTPGPGERVWVCVPWCTGGASLPDDCSLWPALLKPRPPHLPTVFRLPAWLHLFVCRVHSLNCLRQCFQDARLSADTSAALAEGLRACILGIAAPQWEVGMWDGEEEGEASTHVCVYMP